jgi:xanthine/CO dehydrogenase XdhC/CoxF family maturation factor
MSEETDLAWGQGAGCNGTIDILLEPVTENLQEDLFKVKRLLESNTQILALKKLGDTGEYLFIPSEGRPFGQWNGEVPSHDSNVKNGRWASQPIFQQLIIPKPILIVFGAGPDAVPVVSLAANIGFSVTVCDWREEFCRKKNFPSAERLIIGYPGELLEKIPFSANDFVVIMSHHFQRDQEILLSLLQKELKYIGVLGPRERTKRLLKVESIPNRISSPIGASIGAKGPEEIAVSIVAEMIKVWRSPSCKSMENLWTVPD